MEVSYLANSCCTGAMGNGFHGSRSSHSRRSLDRPSDISPSRPEQFEGHYMIAITTQADLDLLRNLYRALDSIEMDLRSARRDVVDSEGFAEQAALYISMFLIGLCLPFCHPGRDVLDFLDLTST